MIYLGIDMGSSFTKAAVFDTETCRAIRHTTFPAGRRLPNPDPKQFELRASEQAAVVRGIVDSTLRETGTLDGVLLSTQMHGFVYRHENAPDLYVSWQDSRCTNPMPGRDESFMEFLKKLIPPGKMTDCGVSVKPSLGLCNLYAMLHGESPVPDGGELYTLGSYVIAALTGRSVCHLSNAAPLGLANVKARRWNRELIETLGFQDIRLPEIAAADFEPCGFYETNGVRIPVYPDFGDQQTAILGCMAGPEDVVVNIATASQISVTTGRFSPGEYEVRPYFEQKYLNTISNMPGGRNLDVLINLLREAAERIGGAPVSAKQVWGAVLNGFEQDSRGLSVDMGFYDTPSNVEGGGISHIHPENLGIGPLFSAAFEAMARCYRENIRTLTGYSAPEGGLVFSGGVSWKTPQLLKVVGRETGLPYRLSSMPDEVFAGLFRASLVCSGTIRSLSERPELTLKL